MDGNMNPQKRLIAYRINFKIGLRLYFFFKGKMKIFNYLDTRRLEI